MVLRVALTGGFASGKSTILTRFAALGAPTIDADRIARQLVEPASPALQRIVSRFGPDMIDAGGQLHRARLAALVFEDPTARHDLEAILHPEVYSRIDRWFHAIGHDAHTLGIADIPLLYETGHEADFHVVVVAVCSTATQIARAMGRDGAPREEIERRLAAQWPLETKALRADFCIDTESTIADTIRQTDEVYRELLRRAEALGRSSLGPASS